MNRRGFLKLMGGVVGGIALEQAIPLGRVWSFPKRIVVGPSQIIPIGATFPVKWTRLSDIPLLFRIPLSDDDLKGLTREGQYKALATVRDAMSRSLRVTGSELRVTTSLKGVR